MLATANSGRAVVPQFERLGDAQVQREEREEMRISPFLANLLSGMATRLSGTADLRESTVSNSCGYMRISLTGTDIVYVEGLYIEEDKQLDGCGSKFLDALESVLSKLAMHTMKIQLWPVRSAIGFYMKNGYDLVVDVPKSEAYYNQKKKLYGDGWDKHMATVRAKLMQQVADEDSTNTRGYAKWDHEMLYPLFKESGFDSDNPMFYSFWIGDVSNGDYSHACKIIQPTRSVQMSSSV